MRALLLTLLIGITAISCTKLGENRIDPYARVRDLGKLDIDDEFTWTTGQKVALTVQVSSPILDVEGKGVQLIIDGEVEDQKIVKNGQVEFLLAKPYNANRAWLRFPNTGEELEIDYSGQMSFVVAGRSRIDQLNDTTINKRGFGSSIPLGKTMGDIMVNGGFDVNDIPEISGNYTNLRPRGKWYVQDDDDGERDQINNDWVFVGTENSWVGIFQSHAAPANTAFSLSFDYFSNGNNRVDAFVDYFNSNGNLIGSSTVNQSTRNGTGLGSLTDNTPSNTAFIQVAIYLRKNSWVDNVALNITIGPPDADGDSVVDNQDDYPNDPLRAYNSYFPTTGYQTLAFEDLWPYQGDYDFNDMVVSNQVNYVRNANNELVEAIVSISLDAVGSGFSNGLAMVLLDANKNAFSQNIIASVSGDATLDPNVTNGLIVFNDVFAAQSTYYQNNNQGPTATPDVFTFTITFNSNVGTANVLPDTYIFRTNDRGLEIHTLGFSPTAAASTNYFSLGADVNGTYQTQTGLPWGIEILSLNKDFKHPNEKIDITQAYPNFQTWAQSSGAQAANWVDGFVGALIFP